MKPLCFMEDGLGAVLGRSAMLVLALITVAAGIRLLAYAGALADRRFLYLSRLQRAFIGLASIAAGSGMSALALYFLIMRPICGDGP